MKYYHKRIKCNIATICVTLNLNYYCQQRKNTYHLKQDRYHIKPEVRNKTEVLIFVISYGFIKATQNLATAYVNFFPVSYRNCLAFLEMYILKEDYKQASYPYITCNNT